MASGNIFFPGYYPGQPVFRAPRGGRPKYDEYTYGAIDEYLNQFDINNVDIGAVPRWVWKHAWDDIKETLSVIYVKPESTSYDPAIVKDFSKEEIQELPGVSGITLNLNPIDWIEGPEKQIKKTLRNWRGAVFSWDDFNKRAQKELVWNQLILGAPVVGPFGMKIDTSKFQLARKAEGEDIGTHGEIPIGSVTPLQLKGLGVFYKMSKGKVYDGTRWNDAEKDVDAFEEVGKRFKHFTQAVDSMITRYKSYKELQQASIKALDASLKKSFGSGSNMDAVEKSRVKDENGNDILDANGNYVTVIDIDKSVNAYSAGYYKSVITSETDAMLAEGFMVQAFYAKQLESLEDAQSKLSTAMEKLISGVGDTQTALDEVNKRLRSLNNQVQYTQIAVGKLQRFKSTYGGANSISFFRNLDGHLSTVQGTLGRFSSLIDGSGFKRLLENADTKSRLVAVQQAMSMRPELIAAGKGMFGGDILTNRGLGFKGGYYEQYLGRMMNRQLLSHPDSAFSKMLSNNKVIGGNRLASYLTYAAKTYSLNDFKDLIVNIEKGKYLGLYGWTLFLRERYKYLTPAYYTELFMRKMHYFGLNIQSDEKIKTFRIADRLFKSSLFANRFKLTGSGGMLIVQGGKHFDVPIEMLSLLTKGGFGPVTKVGEEITDFDPVTIQRFFDYLNKKFFDGAEIPEEATKWLEKLTDFKAWLMKDDNYKKFGIAVVNGEIVQSKENLSRLAKLFKQINRIKESKGHINPTVDYVGFLQRLSSRLNQLQTWLYKSKVGKFVAQFISLTYYIKTTIAEAVAGFFSGLITAGTEGIGLIIAPIVDRLVKYVVIKILNFGEMILKALFKLDFSDLGKMLEDGINLMLKTAGVIFLLFGLVMVGIIFFITAFISAIPPSNPVKGSDYFAPGTGGDGVSENFYVALIKNVHIVYKDAGGADVSVDNPESIPAEAVGGSGAGVRYSVKIHAKKDIYNVKYTDIVKYSSSGSSGDIKSYAETSLPDIKEGDDYSFDLPATADPAIVLNDAKYKNSLITNTAKITGSYKNPSTKVVFNFDINVTRIFAIGTFSSSCPLINGVISTGSYDGWAGSGHGSNNYWGAGKIPCSYAIPYLSLSTGGVNPGPDVCSSTPRSGGIACAPLQDKCKGADTSTCSKCNALHRKPQQSYYGYAIDVDSDNETLYVPQLGSVTSWIQASAAIPIADGNWGYGVLFKSNDDNWLMYFGHINDPGTTIGKSFGVGEEISSLFSSAGFNSHVHIELSEKGSSGYIPIKPESKMCN